MSDELTLVRRLRADIKTFKQQRSVRAESLDPVTANLRKEICKYEGRSFRAELHPGRPSANADAFELQLCSDLCHFLGKKHHEADINSEYRLLHVMSLPR